MTNKPTTVLLIEDDRDFVTVIKEGLMASRDPSFDVECEEDLAGGLARLSKGGIDVVLLDLKLRDSDGLATLSKVHARAMDLPIIVLTGEYGEELGPQTLKQGAQDYLTKGRVDRDILIRSIRYSIERKRQEAETKQLVSSLPSILIGIDSDDLIRHWNSVAEQVFGIPHSKVFRKPLSQCGLDWDLRRVVQGIAECRANEKPLRLDDVAFKGADGKERLLGVTVNPLRDVPSEGRVGILIFGADITERRQLEAHVRQTSKMESLGVFASGMAHEIKKMLNPLRGNIALIGKGLPQESKELERCQRAEACIMHINDFVNQILTFGRKGEEKKRPVELVKVINEGLHLIEGMLPPNVQLSLSLTEQPATIFADSNQIHQILMNLCTNACSAMEESGGRLSISVDVVQIDEHSAQSNPKLRAGFYAKLSVGDSGRGIDPQVISRIFEPFFTTKPEGEGTGMGLAVVYGIVTSHGGDVLVTSARGRGTTFDVYFPQIQTRDTAHQDHIR